MRLTILMMLLSTAAAQPPRAYFWWLPTVHAHQVPRDPPRTYVFGGAQEAIDIDWVFKNDEGFDTVSVVPEALESGIVLRVKTGDLIVETSRDWASEGKWVHESEPAAVSAQETVLLHPGDWIEWRMTLRRKDGAAWGLGTYEYEIDMGRAFGALRLGKLPWLFRAVRQGSLTVIIEDGTTKEARRAEHIFHATDAMAARRPDEAVEHYRQMLAEDPADVDAYGRLGVALMAAHKFKEAIGPLERALPQAVEFSRTKEWSMLPERLAFAYLAIGDEPNAVRVLRLVTDESRIPERLEWLRAAVRKSNR